MANGTANTGGGLDLSSLLNNKLILQYLAAAGQDIGSGSQVGTNVNQVTQQNISAQNYAKLLRTMLSNGGKLTMDKDNVNIKAPTSALQPQGSGASNELPPGSAASMGVNNPTIKTGSPENNLLSSLLLGGGENPSPSPLGIGEIPASDLAGLTPQDISSALKFKFEKEAMSDQKARDEIDRLYKLSQISQGEAATELAQVKELRQWEELLRTSPLEVPGLGRLSLDTWKELPTDVKAYSYYAFTATQGGEDVLSFNEFKQQADPASLVQYYNLALEDPAFREFYFASKKAGATQITIGEKVETKRATEWVDFENNLPDKLNKYLLSDEVQDKLIQLDPGSEEEKFAMAEAKAKYIDDQIRNRGEIVSATIDEKTGVGTWTVRTKTGRTETIRYALYD